jgi:hypothetical protein
MPLAISRLIEAVAGGGSRPVTVITHAGGHERCTNRSTFATLPPGAALEDIPLYTQNPVPPVEAALRYIAARYHRWCGPVNGAYAPTEPGE